MSDKIYSALLAVILLLTPALLTAQPGEDSFLQAWEKIQKDDPKTAIFEKIAKNRYRFKTERFPFDGELRILNITIDDKNISSEYNYLMGVIEVELADLPESFFQKYSYSYSIWARSNMLYYNATDNKWVTSNEILSVQQPEVKGCFTGKFSSLIFDNFFLIIFIFLLIVFIFAVRATKKQQLKYKKYMDNSEEKINKSFELSQQSLRLNEESLKTQKQILELLKNKRNA